MDGLSLLLTLSAPEILGFSTNGGRREPPVRVRQVIAIGLCRRSGWNKRKAQPPRASAIDIIGYLPIARTCMTPVGELKRTIQVISAIGRDTESQASILGVMNVVLDPMRF